MISSTPIGVDARQQPLDLQVVRTDALQRRQRPEQHVVDAAKAAGLLDDVDVLRLFDDADHAVIAGGVGAVDAGIDVGEVVADRAVGDAILDVADGVAQPLGVLARGLEDVKREPLRALGADARQALELIDEMLQRARQRHRVSLQTGQAEAAHDAADLALQLLVDLAQRVVDGGDDQVLQHLDIVFRDDVRIDRQLLHVLVAVDDDGDHAAAGGALDADAWTSPSAAAPAAAAPASSSAAGSRYSSSTFDFWTGKISNSACTDGIGHRFAAEGLLVTAPLVRRVRAAASGATRCRRCANGRCAGRIGDGDGHRNAAAADLLRDLLEPAASSRRTAVSAPSGWAET